MSNKPETRVSKSRSFLAIAGAVAALAAPPAAAAPKPAAIGDDGSERVQRLDAMLKVTAMRCESRGEGFDTDYRTFSRQHRGDLDTAAQHMRSAYLHAYGAKNGQRALERMNLGMANQYGAGHPWLDCGQLRQVTQGLAIAIGREPLVETAGQLLGYRPVQTIPALAIR